jgi:Phytanoyl-CoA dioxygenase (PhyH)
MGPLEVTAEQVDQFKTEGYILFENAVPNHLLEILREECAYFVRREDEKMDKLGLDQIGITHRNKRYHAAFAVRERPSLGSYVFNDVLKTLCKALMGPDAYLFFDGFVVKGAEGGMRLAWHQDSGYVNAVDGDIDHKPYITVWCPLDDVTEENGTIYILPFSEIGIKTWVRHEFDQPSNDWVGYFGRAKGVPVVARAGALAVFSSLTMHSSGANRTPHLRRAYITQYSPEPVLTADRKMLWGNALPFLRGGKEAIGEPAPDLPYRIDRVSHGNEQLSDSAKTK